MFENIFILIVKLFFFEFKILKYEIKETQTDFMNDLNLMYKPFYYEFEIEYKSNKAFLFLCKFIRIFMKRKDEFDKGLEKTKSMKYSGYDVVSLKNDSFLDLRKDWFKFKLFLFEN